MTTEETPEYDPGDHTVEEVKTYVEDHPDECQEVLDAEVDGKNRRTLVEWLESLDDAANDPTVIDESPADDEGNRPESARTDPNTYPDPENPPHTP